MVRVSAWFFWLQGLGLQALSFGFRAQGLVFGVWPWGISDLLQMLVELVGSTCIEPHEKTRRPSDLPLQVEATLGNLCF